MFAPLPLFPECLQEPPPVGEAASGSLGFIRTRDHVGDLFPVHLTQNTQKWHF